MVAFDLDGGGFCVAVESDEWRDFYDDLFGVSLAHELKLTENRNFVNDLFLKTETT